MPEPIDFQTVDLAILLSERSVQQLVDIALEHPRWSNKQIIAAHPKNASGEQAFTFVEGVAILKRLHLDRVIQREVRQISEGKWEQTDSEEVRTKLTAVLPDFLDYIKHRQNYKQFSHQQPAAPSVPASLQSSPQLGAAPLQLPQPKPTPAPQPNIMQQPVAAAQLPSFATQRIPLYRRFDRFFSLAKQFSVTLVLSFLFFFGGSLLFDTMFQATTVAAKIGMFFAFTALTCGVFFFLYSLKYYLTIAVILSFSRQEPKEDHTSWFAKLFGFSVSIENETANGVKAAKTGLGLQTDINTIQLERQPFVSVHVATYNEKRVIDRFLLAASSLAYPNYEVIVADDSTDETVQLLAQWQNHPKVKISHRTSRAGYKGGALKQALTLTDPRAEFILVFDADFIPYPDAITQFLQYFQATIGSLQPETFRKSPVATVQGYQWHVLNKSENWITRGVRTEYAGSYVIERSSAEIYQGLKQISGSVYMIRKDILEQIGWGTSITEDFELTLKLYEKGFKVLYTPYIQAPAEAVSTIKRLIRQRMRWAEGHSFNVKQRFGKLLYSSRLTRAEKLEFLYLSPYYLQAFLFLLGTFCWFAAESVFHTRLPFWTEVWGWSLVLTNLFALPLMNLVGLFMEDASERDYLGLFSFILLSYILAPFQAFAAVKGFLEKEEGPWFRTPKTGRITDSFVPGRIGRFISGLFGRPATSLQISNVPLNPAFSPSQPLPHQRRNHGLRWRGRSILALTLIAVMLLNYLAFFPAGHKAQAAWYDSNYKYKKQVTIDHTKVVINNATPTFMESGTDATQDMSFYDAVEHVTTGTVTSDSSIHHTGSRSLAFNNGASQGNSDVLKNNVLADSGSRISFYVYFTGLPNADSSFAQAYTNNEGTWIASLAYLNSSAHLCTSAGSSSSCGSTNIVAGTWYHVSIAYTITSASVNQFRLYLNGNPEVSLSNATGVTTASNALVLGLGDNPTGANRQVNIDDIYIDNGTDLSDPGDIRVTNKRPNANGANNQFGTQINNSDAGSGYGTGHSPQVNEQPLNTNAGWRTATGAQAENYAIEDASTGDVNITNKAIVADGAWIYANRASGTCTTPKITNNGTDTNITLATANTLFTNLVSTTSFPTNSATVGIKSCTGALQVNLYEAGMLIAYLGSGDSLPNFPVLITEASDNDLKNYVQNSSGYDIIFTDSTETTKLDEEIEKFVSSTGEFDIWVRIPTLSAATDTIIWMYFDKTGVGSNPSVTGTWNSNYKGVWHLGETSGTPNDSTSYGSNGSITGGVTQGASGKFATAYSFNGSSGYVTVTDPGDGHLDFGTNSLTFSAWMYVNASTGTWQSAVNKGGDSSSEPGYDLYTSTAGTGVAGELADNSSHSVSNSYSTVSLGQWYHFTIVVDRNAQQLRLYRNGFIDSTQDDTTSILSIDNGYNLHFGVRYDANGTWFNGKLQEVKIINGVESAGWIATEYNNQNSPATFESFGSSLSTPENLLPFIPLVLFLPKLAEYLKKRRRLRLAVAQYKAVTNRSRIPILNRKNKSIHA